MDPKKRDMQGLRDILWDQIEKVQNKEIDLDRAAVIIKGAETIIHSFKIEIQHALAFGKKQVHGLELPHVEKAPEAEGEVIDVTGEGRAVEVEGRGVEGEEPGES